MTIITFSNLCTILNSNEKGDHCELTGITIWEVARMQLSERASVLTSYAFTISSQSDVQTSGV